MGNREMKVLYITTMYPIPKYPQKGIFCHEQVKALKELGVEVDVVVPIPFYDREVTVKEWTYEGVKIRYIRFFKLPGARDFHKTGNALYRVLKRTLDLGQYNIYHADAAMPTGYAMKLASEKFVKPFVVHGHGLDVFLGESYAGLKNCNKIIRSCEQVYQEADAVIGVSQKVLDKIQLKVDIKGKAFVAYNGVDVEKFIPIDKNKAGDVVRIISIGNLIPLKGHEYTLRAIRQLVDDGYSNLEFHLVGRGRLEEQLKQLVNELRLEEYVTFYGYVPYADVIDILQQSDIFVLPSYYEALGCVYLEAMACGLPAIGCEGNGIDEIIYNGRDGYLIKEKNVLQIVNCLKDLFDISKREEIGSTARETVSMKYTWRDSANSVLAVYQRLIRVTGEDGN